MTKFLSKQEAILLIGKSDSTLRKWRDKITKEDNHPDRGGILPNAEDAAKLHAHKKPFQFTYSEDLLRRAFLADAPEQPTAAKAGWQGSDADAISKFADAFDKVFEDKQKQIEKLETKVEALEKENLQLTADKSRMQTIIALSGDDLKMKLASGEPFSVDTQGTRPEDSDSTDKNPVESATAKATENNKRRFFFFRTKEAQSEVGK